MGIQVLFRQAEKCQTSGQGTGDQARPLQGRSPIYYVSAHGVRSFNRLLKNRNYSYRNYRFWRASREIAGIRRRRRTIAPGQAAAARAANQPENFTKPFVGKSLRIC